MSLFKYIDLFAGIGGFHAAMHMLGGECVFASEINDDAISTYSKNWNMKVSGDITKITEDCSKIPDHDVLCAGFPCQPFSKSGKQKGMTEERGTLFFHIEKIIKEKKPKVILLENVRNISGPRHRHEWETIINSLISAGYVVNREPIIMSPHLLTKEQGGRPQIRERVFIFAYKNDNNKSLELNQDFYIKEMVNKKHNASNWNLYEYIDNSADRSYNLKIDELEWIETWNKLVISGINLPSFPLWFDDFLSNNDLIKKHGGKEVFSSYPKWKIDILTKNSSFYEDNKTTINKWIKQNPEIEGFPNSRRKLEWQAQDAPSLFDTIIHFRPSGIRAKKPTYAPALVAITQTTILGKERRRMTPRETARLQAFPEWFDFSEQTEAATYKQLGNAVNVNTVYWMMRNYLIENRDNIKHVFPQVDDVIINSLENPDQYVWQ